jgi:hypothetical protein
MDFPRLYELLTYRDTAANAAVYKSQSSESLNSVKFRLIVIIPFFVTYKSVCQFTFIEHNTPSNGEVRGSVQNCVSSVWNFAFCHSFSTSNFEANLGFS